MKKLKSLALVGVLTVVGTAPTHAQNLIFNGDFTANAALFVEWPGGTNPHEGNTGNPSDISGWVNYFEAFGLGIASQGLGGAATGVGSVPYANPFGPQNTSGFTYAFLHGSGGGNLLAQYVPLAVNTTYQLDYDVAGRWFSTGDYKVVVAADPGGPVFYDSGVITGNTLAFDHVTAFFTTPASFGTGSPDIQLWNMSGAGDTTVNFANVSIVAVPEPTTAGLVGLAIVMAGVGRWARRRTA